MAIAIASLAEEILSRQERAVIRGIYRAFQLGEALVALDKVTQTLQPMDQRLNGALTNGDIENALPIRNYLAQSMRNALVSTKVPSASSNEKVTSSKQEAKQ